MTGPRVVAAALALAVAAGCGGGGDDDEGGRNRPATTEAAQGPSDPAVPGLELLDAEPPAAGELRPLLAWAPFEGAARYSVLVFDSDGDAYWAWEGAETQVHLGGGTDEPLAEDVEGPTTEHAASWFVVAHDADGTPIAASAELDFRE